MDQHNSAGNADLVRYDTGAFIKTYVKDGAVYYASFHPELYSEEDGLDSTGRYLVVLLQDSGLTEIYLTCQNGKWIPDEDNFSDIDKDQTVEIKLNNAEEDTEIPTRQFDQFIAPDMLEWLSDAINNHKL